MQKAAFTIDDMVNVDGIHDPHETWNGWACPLFPIDSVRIIAEWADTLDEESKDHGVPFVDDAGRVFWCNDIGSDQLLPVDVDGVDYFEIGAYGWIWSTVES